MNPVKIKSLLNKTKSLKINGIKFVIKRLSIIDFFEDKLFPFGFTESLDEKRIREHMNQKMDFNKLKDHYKTLFMKGVVKPKLTEVDSEDSVCVDELFKDWELVNKLYTEIFLLSFGKKKNFERFLKKGL